MSNIDKHGLLGVPKHANQHRLSRLTMEVHTDELRILASAVESYTDELIAALEAAEKRIAEIQALARGVKQFSEFQICHYGATEDYAKGYIDCQNNYNKVLFAVAGKGEES